MTPAMPTAHLVYGPIAAGKTTYARQLAARRGAVRFSIDDWMQTLFGADLRGSIDMAWVLERVGRCQEVIWSTSLQVLASGRDVVLEIGLLRAADRDVMRQRVEAANVECRFHFVDAPREIRLERVRRRNASRGETYSFEVTPAMFDAIEQIFKGPVKHDAGHCHRRHDEVPVD